MKPPTPPPDARAAIWQTYGFWAAWVAVAFFTVYPACNGFSAQRDPASWRRFYLAAELHVPLMPQFIWVYLSMYALFLLPPFFLDVAALQRLGKRLIAGTLLSGAIFLLFPAPIGFIRVLPEDPLYAAIFARIFALDPPFNTVPSLHVVFSALIVGALAYSAQCRWLRGVWYGWLALICLSTLLVHQHHVADIAAGLLLALLLQSRSGVFGAIDGKQEGE
ncbi:MAG: hypothetical protein LBE62_07240 [Azonexus sp.]|jgi:membrane-associated phospholipid phosphatase|nr:hypothetical protein [Azonexus sp.]